MQFFFFVCSSVPLISIKLSAKMEYIVLIHLYLSVSNFVLVYVFSSLLQNECYSLVYTTITNNAKIVKKENLTKFYAALKTIT